MFLEKRNTSNKQFLNCFNTVLILLMILIFSQCSNKIYFTKSVRNDLENKNISLNKLQFYVDRELCLKREVNSGETTLKEGAVQSENGKLINVVILKKGIPGIATKIENNKLEIAFEEGEDKSLVFEATSLGFYDIVPSMRITTKSMVLYDKKLYELPDKSVNTFLMIKKSEVENLQVDKYKMKGLKVK